MSVKENFQAEEQAFFKFDPFLLVRDILKRWALILLVALAVGMSAYIFSSVSYKPVYKTSITYVTYTRSSSATVYSNLSSANLVASVFEELLNSSLLRNTIMQESGIASFDGVISASVVAETNLITVNISGSDPRSVFLMAQAIVDHHEVVTYQVVDNVSLELLRSPTVPMSPSNISGATDLAKKAGIVAAAAMVILIGFLSFQKDTVRSAGEAKSKLDCSFLGDIPHERKYKTLTHLLRRRKSSILVTNPVTSFRFVETFRKLASRVEYHMHGKKVVMVTSLLANEGKSTVSVNLAMAMALKHDKVLLIDCDLRKPSCCTLMEQSNIKHGLCEVLEGKVNLHSALLQDKKSGLYMLLETNATEDSDEYLSCENMHTLLAWARENFDLIVLDLPPMALVSDAENVMDLADYSMLVVRQNMSRATGINKAITTLEDGKAKLLGCVLNDVRTSWLSHSGYGSAKYGYYGKYGHYGHYGQYSSYHNDKNND